MTAAIAMIVIIILVLLLLLVWKLDRRLAKIQDDSFAPVMRPPNISRPMEEWRTVTLADEPQIEESTYALDPQAEFALREAKIQEAKDKARAEARQLIIQNWERK